METGWYNINSWRDPKLNPYEDLIPGNISRGTNPFALYHHHYENSGEIDYLNIIREKLPNAHHVDWARSSTIYDAERRNVGAVWSQNLYPQRHGGQQAYLMVLYRRI